MSKKVPVYTTGNVGKPSKKVSSKDTDGCTYVSAYTGKELDSHPTFNTPTDDPTGKNKTYHGGLHIGNNTVVFHKYMGNQNSYL
mmetsp:Transcript_19790/g.16958  ORF Transcript_19790/g.16958 Transcript_19790/m.16958 type:complete len:84 (+) Transcript_19790:61-312(+)